MALSRRKFVGTLGAGAVALTAGANSFGQIARQAGALGVPVASTTDPLSYLSREQFVPLVGMAFPARTSTGKSVNLTLMEVSDLTLKQNVSKGYTGESFSLLFDAGRKGLASETYTFDNRFLGKFALFISPVGMRGTRYEAVVNRIAR